MKKIITVLTFLCVVLSIPGKIKTQNNTSISLISKYKFFVKTKMELRVSEATGKISLSTGYASLDEKIAKYNITEIKRQFLLNNGNKSLFEKYEMSRIYLFSIAVNSGKILQDAVEEFNKDSHVEYSEPNYIGTSAGVNEYRFKKLFEEDLTNKIPNDEMFYRQWYLQNSGSVEPSSSGGNAKIGADIKMINGWQIEEGSEEVIVAILDSGIKDDHPDLRDRIWINKNEIPNNGIDDDFNGYIDDTKGWDFAYDDRRPEDGFGHGTNIATVIGANINNGIGYAGIDGNCKLMNCKNLNSDNSGEYGWWAESIKYATDNGARIINMSEGGDDYSKVLKTAIRYAMDNGSLVVAAMMNKGDDRDYYPASYEGVFSVGATDTDDRRCKKFSWGGGSCWGKHISVVAPGNKIYGLDYESDSNYEVYWSGTSQATAIVSGIASLLLAQDLTRTSDDLKSIIKISSKDLVGDLREDTPGWDQFYGYGRVDSYAALSYENKKTITEEEFKQDDEVKETEEEPEIENSEINEKDKPSKASKDNQPSKPE